MTAQAIPTSAPSSVIHPAWVRITHWVNAIAMLIMIGSGWQIYDASPLFRFEKRAQALLHRLFPRLLIPLYTMISFTRIPYAEARNRARLQARVVRGVLALVALAVAIVLWYLIR